MMGAGNNMNDAWMKVIGIIIILLLLKILLAIQTTQAITYDCPICVEELPPTNQTKCIQMYGVNEENFDECMWLLENQPALQ